MQAGEAKQALNKKKLLYIFKKFNRPVTNAELTNFVLKNDYFDYFILQEILNLLIDIKFVKTINQDGHEFFELTDSGLETIIMFEDNLPSYFVDEVKEQFHVFTKEQENKEAIFSHFYQKSEDEFIVVIEVLDNRKVIFDLSLHVPTKDIAFKLCQKWNENPSELYTQILTTLTQDL